MKIKILFLCLLANMLNSNAQTLLVDDFKSGALPVVESKTPQAQAFVQSGTTILGQNRVISAMTTPKYDQKMYISILTKEGLMLVSGCYGAGYRVELSYGRDIKGNNLPLKLNMTKYKRLNIEFDGIVNDLNFNTVLFSPLGRSQISENISGNAIIAPTYTYSMPVDKFSNACCKIENFDAKNVSHIVFVFQPTTYHLGTQFAIKRIWFD